MQTTVEIHLRQIIPQAKKDEEAKRFLSERVCEQEARIRGLEADLAAARGEAGTLQERVANLHSVIRVRDADARSRLQAKDDEICLEREQRQRPRVQRDAERRLRHQAEADRDEEKRRCREAEAAQLEQAQHTESLIRQAEGDAGLRLAEERAARETAEAEATQALRSVRRLRNHCRDCGENCGRGTSNVSSCPAASR